MDTFGLQSFDSSDIVALNSTKTESTISASLQSIDDGIDEAEFEQSIQDLMLSIQQQMSTYGDLELDVNNLKNVEFRIQSERIVRLMDECVVNVHFGFLLPAMLQDTANERAMQMTGRLEPEVKERLQDVCQLLSGDEAGLQVGECFADYFTELDYCMRSAEKCGFKALILEYVDKLSAEQVRFIDCLAHFAKIAKLRIFWTAPKAMAKEKRLYTMWTENQTNVEMVAELHRQVDEAQRRMQGRNAADEAVLTEYKSKVEQLITKNEDRIDKTIYESNLKMNKTSVDSETKQKELLNRANKIKEEYETMLRDNLLSGRKLRENKGKTQQKLAAWLLKYDTEVGERSQELFRLKDQLSAETVTFRKWMVKFEEQEIEYLDVEAQILAEFIRVRDEKVRIFTLHYAAKTIQRAFRKMMKKRKLARRKGKKGKKK